MKICAITMVHKDYWALSQWYQHYGNLLGAANLFVIAHGADPTIQRICPEASVITIPRDRLQGFDHWRGRLLNGFQSGLLELYDWVIRTDADELICVDPARWASLADMLSVQTSGALFALGLNLFDLDTASAGSSTTGSPGADVVFSGHYSKAWALSQPHNLRRHGVEVRPRRLADFPFDMPRGVFLAHLKFANWQAATEMAAVREEVAASEGSGTPGKAWRKARKETDAQYQRAAALPVKSWQDAEDEAWNALQAPVRDPSISVLRAQSLRFNCRTRLPDWFFASKGKLPPAPGSSS